MRRALLERGGDASRDAHMLSRIRKLYILSLNLDTSGEGDCGLARDVGKLLRACEDSQASGANTIESSMWEEETQTL